jgi:hypothetical protein
MDVKGVVDNGSGMIKAGCMFFYMHAFSIVCSRLLISQSLVTTAFGKYFPLL